MPVSDYERAKALIKENGGGGFIGPRSDEWISEAERLLGFWFPPTYRQFLRELGCGNFYSEYFYGIIDADLLRGPVPNAVWLTLDERRSTELAPSFIIIQSTGDGGWYAIDTAQRNVDGESPVLFLDTNGRPQEVVAPDFGLFFLDRIVSIVRRNDRETRGTE